MAKRDLAEWAAISEIVGMLAVIISLLLVAFNLNQNTRVMQAANDNFLYQTQDAILSSIVDESDFAAIQIKFQNNEELTPVEELRLRNQGVRDLFMWELAFVRSKEGLFAPDQWSAWNQSYSIQFASEYPEDWWEETRPWVREDFAIHVDKVYAAARD